MKHIIIIIFYIITCGVNYSQWTEQNTGVTKKLNHCRIFTGEITWVCGDSGVVLRTTNNGASWTNLTGNGIPLNVNLISISGLNDNVVIIGGNTSAGSVIYMSSNSGASWFQVFSQPGGTLRGLGTHLYVGDPVGGRWSLWWTTNYGLTWDSTGRYLAQNGSEHGLNNSYFSYAGDDYILAFGTNNYRIYSKNNTTWSVITFPEQNVYSLHWDSYLALGYAGGSNLYQTTDRGESWQQVALSGTGNIAGIAAQPGYALTLVSRGNNQIFLKTNSGSWTFDYSSPSGNYNFLRTGNSWNNLYAIRDNGLISKRTLTPPPLGINQISSEIPNEFSLSQNYPNPFNPTTNIKFQIPMAGFVKLIIYDALGKEIQTLVNEQLSPGTYEVDFDGSNQPSGVYFYKLESGTFTETKKMVLVK